MIPFSNTSRRFGDLLFHEHHCEFVGHRYARTPQARALLPESVEDILDVSRWYLLKLFLDRPEVKAGEVSQQREIAMTIGKQAAQQTEQIPDARMHEMLQPAQVSSADGIDIGTEDVYICIYSKVYLGIPYKISGGPHRVLESSNSIAERAPPCSLFT